MKSTVGTALLLISFLFAIATGQTTKRLETQGNTGISSLQVFGGSWGLLNANRLTYWGRSDGTGGHSPKGNDGGFFPRGTGHVLYEDGFVWGGKVFRNSQLNRPASTQPIRVGGAYYWPTRPGSPTPQSRCRCPRPEQTAETAGQSPRRDDRWHA